MIDYFLLKVSFAWLWWNRARFIGLKASRSPHRT